MNNLMQMLQNLNSNPLFVQAQKMANGKSEQEILFIAQNICKEKGIDFNEAYQQFQKMMKGM